MRAAAATLAFLLCGSRRAAGPGAVPRPAAPRPPDLKAIAALIEKGDTAAAERQLQGIIASSGDPGARQLLARLRFEQKRDAEAIVELRKAAAAAPLPPTSGFGGGRRDRDGHPALAERSCAVAERYGPCRP